MTIRWLNGAGREHVGDHVGERYTAILEPGTLVRAEVSSVPVRGGQSIAGVFGLVAIDEQRPAPRAADGDVSLTPRQAQVLHLLARGCSTEQMADELGVALETIRNHVRAIFRRLGVHSRLEAVIEAQQRGLV